jgi:uncharacterized protein YndB with AHSA1/START domain
MIFLTEFEGQESVRLSSSPRDVYDLLVDVDRLPEWNAAIDHVIERPAGPLAPGVEWVVEMRAMGTRWPSRSRASVVDRDKLAFAHTTQSDDGNPSFVTWTWNVDRAPEGCRLTVRWAAHPRTFWRKLLLARMRRPVLAGEVRASLAGIDAYLHDARLRSSR